MITINVGSFEGIHVVDYEYLNNSLEGHSRATVSTTSDDIIISFTTL